MHISPIPFFGLIGFCVLGIVQPASANCRVELNACIAESDGHPHICDNLVRNMSVFEANERKGADKVVLEPRFTKVGIDALYKRRPPEGTVSADASADIKR
jgi:hypothetical protein